MLLMNDWEEEVVKRQCQFCPHWSEDNGCDVDDKFQHPIPDCGVYFDEVLSK